MIVIISFKRIISDEAKHNFLESSKTEFISSIHIASTGPSNIIQYLTLPEVSRLNSFIIVGTIPKDHSPVSAFCSEYNCPCVIAFGFIMLVLVLKYVLSSAKRLMASLNTL